MRSRSKQRCKPRSLRGDAGGLGVWIVAAAAAEAIRKSRDVDPSRRLVVVPLAVIAHAHVVARRDERADVQRRVVADEVPDLLKRALGRR